MKTKNFPNGARDVEEASEWDAEGALEGAPEGALEGVRDWEEAAERLKGNKTTLTIITNVAMKKTIAIPVSAGILDAHFGHCRQFAMVTVENEEIREVTYLDAPPHQPGLLPPWLADRGCTEVIAGGMGQRAIQLFNQQGINVFVGAPRMTPEELVEGLLKDTLSFSANYCDH
jgi:predicted Fe-Mo cluster-binding NifX family protein